MHVLLRRLVQLLSLVLTPKATIGMNCMLMRQSIILAKLPKRKSSCSLAFNVGSLLKVCLVLVSVLA